MMKWEVEHSHLKYRFLEILQCLLPNPQLHIMRKWNTIMLWTKTLTWQWSSSTVLQDVPGESYSSQHGGWPQHQHAEQVCHYQSLHHDSSMWSCWAPQFDSSWWWHSHQYSTVLQPQHPMEPDLWDGNFYPISLHGSIEYLASDSKSIKDSLNFMAKYINNK